MTGEIPNANVLLRTLWLRCGRTYGTGFTVEVDNQQFVVTAAHVVAAQNAVAIEVMIDNEWRALQGSYIPPSPDHVDVAVFALETRVTVAHPTIFDMDGAVLGQEVFILGYPFDPSASSDLVHQSGGSPMPMVKGGRLAAWMRTVGDLADDILVDCYANQGFSGGPVVGFLPVAGTARKSVTIMGIVSHYVPEHQAVFDEHGRTPLSAETNPGILVALNIRYALDGIARQSG